MSSTMEHMERLGEELRRVKESREHTVRRLSNDRRLDKFIPLRVDQLLDEALSTFPHDTEEDTIVRVITRLERENAEIDPDSPSQDDLKWGRALITNSIRTIREEHMSHLARTASTVFDELEKMEKVDPFIDRNRLADPKIKAAFDKSVGEAIAILYNSLEHSRL